MNTPQALGPAHAPRSGVNVTHPLHDPTLTDCDQSSFVTEGDRARYVARNFQIRENETPMNMFLRLTELTQEMATLGMELEQHKIVTWYMEALRGYYPRLKNKIRQRLDKGYTSTTWLQIQLQLEGLSKMTFQEMRERGLQMQSVELPESLKGMVQGYLPSNSHLLEWELLRHDKLARQRKEREARGITNTSTLSVTWDDYLHGEDTQKPEIETDPGYIDMDSDRNMTHGRLVRADFPLIVEKAIK